MCKIKIMKDGIKPVEVTMAFKLEDYLELKDEYGDVKRKIDWCTKNKVIDHYNH